MSNRTVRGLVCTIMASRGCQFHFGVGGWPYEDVSSSSFSSFLRRMPGRQFLVGACEAGLWVGKYVLVRSPPPLQPTTITSSVELVLALGALVVPRYIWISLLKLPEFLQTAY